MEEDNTLEPQMPNLAKKSEPVDPYAPTGGQRSTSNMGQNFSLSSNEVKKSNKRLILIILGIVVLLGLGFLLFKNKASIKRLVSAPTPTPAPVSTPAPTETPKPVLVRSDWSFEVQNGSGQTGLAKKIGDRIKGLGYIVLKTGNADKDNYPTTQVLVKKELTGKIDLVIADLKDVVKIASFGGELKDSTASARIILGKDSI